MSKGRKIVNEAEAQWCVLAAKRAGCNAGEWARKHGIDGRSLHAWQMNFERRGMRAAGRRRKPKAASTVSALVELVPTVRSAHTVGTARYVLEVAGARVEFGDDASVATLRRVLEALRPC